MGTKSLVAIEMCCLQDGPAMLINEVKGFNLLLEKDPERHSIHTTDSRQADEQRLTIVVLENVAVVGDLKSENILLQDMAVTMNAGVAHRHECEAGGFWVISSGHAGDMWSLGLSVFEWTIMKDVLSPLNSESPGQILNCLQGCWASNCLPFVLGMLKFDRTKRLTAFKISETGIY
ncbi:hypothetical protein BKA62DRAFT_676467 [Auriculariales sp. MPI-PUGE-AT-0066]|nr:hypothetical protein BKA62DRAFT_676467 [Auriculariales sp. MPI-PUGE-AT-0066]